jgi:hypothetical protein
MIPERVTSEAEHRRTTTMATGKPTPQAGDNQKPAPAQQQGSEPSKPSQQQGGPRFTDWASI